MRIAVIGAGISGMSSAYFLSKHHDIHLYETETRLGGHARTLNVDIDGKDVAVDTGFIVFNKRNYPYLTQLFDTVGVEYLPSDMSFAVTVGNGEFEWSGKNLSGVFAQKSNLFKWSFYKFLGQINRFNKQATALVTSEFDHKISLGQFLDTLGVSKDFMNYYLLPMAGAIWSCPPEVMLAFPAKSFLQFFHNHGLLTVTDQPQWYSVKGGSREYIKKLESTGRLGTVKTNSSIRKIIRSGETTFVYDQSGKSEAFDKIIFACHADHILPMLESADQMEQNILSAFRFQDNHVVLHTDEKQMPIREDAWASWVYQKHDQSKDYDKNAIAVTYWMNNLQTFLPKDKNIFVTLNPIKPIDRSKVLNRHVFAHPVFDKNTLNAQNQLHLLQGHRNCYYAGAWTGYGFHEDGIKSAAEVAAKLGVIPFEST